MTDTGSESNKDATAEEGKVEPVPPKAPAPPPPTTTTTTTTTTATDLMDEDEAAHARVDDPVCPPARMPKEYDATGTPVSSSGSGDSILSRLFDPDRKQKPALWSHIKLVAPGPADEPPAGCLKWRSKDAIAAYCLKCRKQFTYTKGTSKTISRHMMAFHGLMSTDGEFRDDDDDDDGIVGGDGEPKEGGTATSSSFVRPAKRQYRKSTGGGDGPSAGVVVVGGGPPLKKRKTSGTGSTILPLNNVSTTVFREGGVATTATVALRNAALLRWLAGSYHSLDLIDGGIGLGPQAQERNRPNNFAAFCKTLNASYRVPSVVNLSRLAYLRNRDILQLIREDIKKECDYFAVSVGAVKVLTQASAPNVVVVYPLQITFCTSQFAKRSYTVEIIHGKEENDSTQMLSYMQSIDTALDEHGLSKEKVTNVTMRGKAMESIQSMIPPDSWMKLQHHPWTPRTALDELNLIVLNAIDTHLNELLTKAAEAQVKLQEGGDDQPSIDSLANLFPSQRAYHTLQQATKLLESDVSALHVSSMPLILSILLPFHDGIQTLSGDGYPTIGLIIPVIRRIRDVLDEVSIQINNRGGETTDTTDQKGEEKEGPDAAVAAAAITDLDKDFFQTIRDGFSKAFSTILDKNPPLMWTMPLDPRLVSMSSLSDEEKEYVTKTLATEIKALVKEINEQKKVTPEGGDGTKGNESVPVQTSDVASSSDGPTETDNTAITEAPAASTSTNTMGGIFWGEDDAAKFETETAKDDYSRRNVESYFNTVRSQRRIEDPLLWWKNNQGQFPELAILARKWMGVSSLYNLPLPSRDDKVIDLNQPNSLPMKIAILLHENQDLI